MQAIVVESLEARAESGKLTGEWIVFARENGKNYWAPRKTSAVLAWCWRTDSGL